MLKHILTLSLLIVLALPAKALILLAEEDPPSSFTENNRVQGFVIDITREIQKRVGSREPITTLPWARAYKLALEKPDIVLLATIRTPEREKYFHWIGSLVESTGNIYALKSNPAKLKNLEDAKRIKGIVTVRGWYTEEFLLKNGFKNIVSVSSPDKMAEMLFSRKDLVIAFDSSTIEYLVRKAGQQMSDIKTILPLGPPRVTYITMSRGTSQEAVQAWQKALESMKKDGTFKRIMEEWIQKSGIPLKYDDSP